MNKGTFAYAMTGINEELIIECLPEKFRKDSNTNKKRTEYIVPLVACLVVGIVFAVLLIANNTFHNQSPVSEEPKNTAIESDTDQGDVYVQYPSMYMNWTNYYSLLRVGSIEFKTVCYTVISREDGTVQKNAVFEAEISEDYYNHLTPGEKILIAFPLNFKHGEYYTFESDRLVEALKSIDSLIFYSHLRNEQNYVYYDEKCIPGEEKNIGRLYFCYYYSEGIIPIRNSAVDFEPINNVFEYNNCPINIQAKYYHNIKMSGISISQGDSFETLSNTIKELIKNKIFGG